MDNTLSAHPLFNDIELDSSWSFSDKSRKETSYATHGYHRYPAKFIPQLAARLIADYTELNELVLDPFCGCGTTNVESKILGRRSVGVDINPVATLISSAKRTALPPADLTASFDRLQEQIQQYKEESIERYPNHQRIDYWFREKEKLKLAYLLQLIEGLPNSDERKFFLCGFSNILKNCSIWLQKSNKPTRDKNKQVSDPFQSFIRHTRMMIRGNQEYFDRLYSLNRLDMQCEIHCEDARNIHIESDTVKLVVTSPPYVTSYEYADLHQLTAFWLNYADSLPSFRKNFIGTAHHETKNLTVNSIIAEQIIERMAEKSKKISNEVRTYFGEMYQVFEEMKRMLIGGGGVEHVWL